MKRYIPLALLLVTAACQDIVEKDLTHTGVVIIAPMDSLQSSSSTVQFDWEEIPGVNGFQLQVAQPEFDHIQRLVMDTLITGNRFTYNFTPGDYTWRIRAMNSGSTGPYTYRTFRIDSSFDLSQQTVILALPPANALFNTNGINFTWQALYNADSYRFVLKRDNWTGEPVIPEVTIATPGYTVNDLEDGTYCWGVRGESALSVSPYSTRIFIIDTQVPAVPVLQSPADNSVWPVVPELQWQQAADEGTDIRDSVYVYSNAQLTQVVFSGVSTTGSISPGDLDSGTYYWRVKSIDMAGNAGAFSGAWNFFLQ